MNPLIPNTYEVIVFILIPIIVTIAAVVIAFKLYASFRARTTPPELPNMQANSDHDSD